MAGRAGRRGQMSAEEKDVFLKKLKEEESDDGSLSSLSSIQQEEQPPSNTPIEKPSPPHHRRVSPYKQQDAGCLACGKDDDHNNLMYCDMCDAEYHYYCLHPPLAAVPSGDWFCNACKPLTATHHHAPIKDDDGLDPLVCALPPRYTERFGEICWAQGGSGFGWWPACIYDPRLTVGGARELARKNLGRRHLVYFFECNIAPFSVLADNKLVKWETGLAENYHTGRTALGHSKARGNLFRQALHIACLEEGKPIDMRMIWNHQGEEPVEHIPLSPPGKRPQRKRARPKETFDKKTKPDKKRRRKGKKTDKESSTSPTNLFDAMDAQELPNEVYCKVTKRKIDASDNEIDESLGFITLDSRDATFVDARAAIQNEMDPDSLPPKEWKFYLQSLGLVSHRQEARLGPVAAFLLKTFDHRLGDGTVDDPFHIVVVGVKPRT